MNEEIHNQFSKRQIDIQKKNLVQICRLTVKTLIDKACITNIDDDSDELINFCAAIEQILTYRQKAQRTWYGIEEVKPFWEFIQAACRSLPNNCINSIATLENVKSPIGKGRAWIRCVLMEKRLSEYLSHAIQQTKLVRRFYQDGSVMLSDEINVLCGVLLGLNSIDFSFCLKGYNQELRSPLYIDYTPYLIFQQSAESLNKDFEELAELSTDTAHTSSSVIGTAQDSWEDKYKSLEKNHKTIKEQKGYLEELVRMREHQLQDLQRKHQNLMSVFKKFDNDSKRDRQQMETVVIELQQQLSSLTAKFEGVNTKYEALIKKLKSGFIDLEEVNPERSIPFESEENLDPYISKDSSIVPESAARLVVPGTRPTQLEPKLETASMLAMAGSFSSQGCTDETSLSDHGNQTKMEENTSLPVSDSEDAIVINFPRNNEKSVTSKDTQNNITLEEPNQNTVSPKMENIKPTLLLTEQEVSSDQNVESGTSSPEVLQGDYSNGSEHSKSGEDNSSYSEVPQEDVSTSSPEIIDPSGGDNSNGSDTSVTEQYDLVTDDLSRFEKDKQKEKEDNENATG